MQTFLPYANFVKTSRCLDYRRLGKQRIEARQIINILDGTTQNSRWRNHPAVKMWSGYLEALKIYYNSIVVEWVRRGYNNNMPLYTINRSKVVLPDWLGNKMFHSSHRSNLLRKKNDFYNQYGWKEPYNLPYIWPRRICEK